VALTEITESIKKAHGKKGELAEIEKGLLGVLSSGAKRAGKQFACRQLSIIGTNASVSTLAKMLTGEETSDMARYALERIPGSAADDALRNALPNAKGKPQVGIINSLGQRRDRKAVGNLTMLLGSPDQTVATAAAAALGQIADAQATKALAKAKDTTKGKVQLRVLDAYLRCADQLLANGKRSQALAIYTELQNKSMPTPIQTAALRGRLNAAKRQR
jgi:HEAT repeat protein